MKRLNETSVSVNDAAHVAMKPYTVGAFPPAAVASGAGGCWIRTPVVRRMASPPLLEGTTAHVPEISVVQLLSPRAGIQNDGDQSTAGDA